MPEPGVLHVIGGNDRGKRFELALAETRIGRGNDQDVVLSDIAVSRRHVTVHLEGGRYRLQDLGSGNGTLINGQRVSSHVLSDGDHIEIGQTVMRFDHPASRAQPAAYAPPAYVPPQPARAVPPAPSAAIPSAPPFGEPPPGLAAETPSEAILSPPPPPPPRPLGLGRWATSGSIPNPIDTPLKKILVFGGMGLVSIIALLIILARTVWAHPAIVPSEGEELYKQGLRLYAAGDFEGAKVNFTEAAADVPDAPQPKSYAKLCDVEIRAHGLMKNAERAIGAHLYGEAVKALDQIDSSSMLYDQAGRLRKETAPKAAIEAVSEARQMAADDPEGARARLKDALALDPNNADAQALAAKLKTGAPMASAEPPPAPEPPPPPPHEERPSHEPKHAHHAAHDDGLAAVKVVPHAGPAGSLSGSALAAYREKDFAGAERVVRQQAISQSAKAAQKTIALANEIKQLRQSLDRADSEEQKSPDAALRDLGTAMTLDAKVSHGVHNAWLRSRMGKLELSYGQHAFQQGRYDVAFQAAQAAQRYGAGDGGLTHQLESKANELVQKGISLQRSNVNQAKQYWRQAMHMVKPSSSIYAKAYTLLNNTATRHQDEDED